MRFAAVGVVGLVMIGAGCGDDDESSSATSAPSGTSTPATSTDPTVLPPSSSPVGTTAASGGVPGVPQAIADLATRLDVDESAITVVEEREVTWSDASLGCPEPGMSYLQQLTDGVLVVLEADGQRYEYHGGDALTYCANPTPPAASD